MDWTHARSTLPSGTASGKSISALYGALAQVRPHWRIVAYHRSHEPVERRLPDGFVEPKLIEMPGDRFDAWPRWRLPLAAWRDGTDILHCPANHCPRWMPVPTVVTIHDLIPMDMPETAPPDASRRFEQSVRIACAQAAAINCPSRYTRDRLVNDLAVRAERVHVTPWGAESQTRPIAEPVRNKVLEKYRIARPFVLHLGAADPRKNTRRVIEAWSVLRRGIRRSWTLLVTGLDAGAQRDLMRTCERFGVLSSVVLQGFAHEQDLPALMAEADVLVYPSLSEGFDMPVLEAFAAETALLTSSRTALPEVAADAALLVEPEDSCAIATGLTRLLGDPVLRAELIRRGRSRLLDFSWSSCAERFARALEEAAGQTRSAGSAA